MELPIAKYGEAALRKKCVPVEKITDEVKQLISDMTETMHASNGIGISAPQVFSDLAIFLTYPPVQQEDESWKSEEVFVYINPKILEYSQEKVEIQEGCLSLPNIYAHIKRPVKIKIEATDLEGNLFQQELTAYQARVFLHENDHINGVLMIDRAEKEERKEIDPLLKILKKQTRQNHK